MPVLAVRGKEFVLATGEMLLNVFVTKGTSPI